MNTMRGKIKSIAVRDFVTFDALKLEPGKYLNVIIGPNGTGKSTIVAAIVIGMGGDCKLLSRSGNITDYVKNGKEKAKIEIHLYENDLKESVVFNRAFSISGANSWEINGLKVTQKEYVRRVAEFNIQIGNLCQFLPQDRVQDFTKMNPYQLLQSTQTSVCTVDVCDTFAKLVDLRATQKTADTAFNENQQKLKQTEQSVQTLAVMAKAIESRQLMLRDVELCTAKRIQIKITNITAVCDETANDLQKANKILAKQEKQFRPIQNSIQVLHEKFATIKKMITHEELRIRQMNEIIGELRDKGERTEDQILLAISTLNDQIAAQHDHHEEIRVAQNLLELLSIDVKRVMSEMGDDTERGNKTKEIDTQINKVKERNTVLNRERQKIQDILHEELKPYINSVNRKIEVLENARYQKLNLLQKRNEDVYNVLMWLRENRNLFKGRIYDPLMLELNIRNREHAKYFENTISQGDQIGFVCERVDDMKLFLRKVSEKFHYMVNAAHSEATDRVLYKANYPLEQLEKYGFYAYMIDMISAPFPILNHLCRLCSIHRVPVGNDLTYRVASQVPDKINLFFSSDHRFTNFRSKYTGEKLSTSSMIYSHNILNMGIDEADLAEQKRIQASIIHKSDELKNKRTTIEGEMEQIAHRLQTLYTTKKDVDAKFNLVVQLNDKIRMQRSKIVKLEAARIDVDKEREKCRGNNGRLVEKLFEIQQQCIEKMCALRKLLRSHRCATEQRRINESVTANIERDVQQQLDEIATKKETCDRITAVLRTSTNKRTTLDHELNVAMNALRIDTMEALQAAFAPFSDNLDRLSDHVVDLQMRMDCLEGFDQTVFDKYEEECRKLAELTESIEGHHASRTELNQQMETLHVRWYEEIQQIVDTINRKFSEFMEYMDYAGEVELVHEEQYDYEKYGIQIRVKYRNDDGFHALDRFVQSGGERAVAIAVYTLALQNITPVPFRCVDEINQGMDPRNERKVFELLVRETSIPEKSQYFFVTPKLLPNLPYNDQIAVHIVYNGPEISHHSVFHRHTLCTNAC